MKKPSDVPDVLDVACLDAVDEGQLDIRHPVSGDPIGWIWTFFGPGHPDTVALADRVTRDALRKSAARRQAIANGRKWKEDDDQSLDDIRKENVANIVARTKTFTPIKLNGELIEFSKDKAAALLLDRRKGWLFKQVTEYLQAEENFIQPSATS